jgi:hypothetical protein
MFYHLVPDSVSNEDIWLTMSGPDGRSRVRNDTLGQHGGRQQILDFDR